RHICVRSTLVPAFHNGEVCELFCIDVDIAERRQISPAPRDSDERFESTVPDAIDLASGGDIVGHVIHQSMFDAHRRPYGNAGSHPHIARREETERLSSVSASKKAAIFDSALDPIIAMDRNGRIVEFNPAAERTFG